MSKVMMALIALVLFLIGLVFFSVTFLGFTQIINTLGAAAKYDILGVDFSLNSMPLVMATLVVSIIFIWAGVFIDERYVSKG